MLELKDVAFKYPSGSTNFNYSLNAKPSDITLIHGASGAGKSTLFDLIAGFLAPHSGELNFGSVSLLGQSPSDRPITTLFQKNNLFDHLSTLENIRLGQKGDKTDILERAERALLEVGLSDQTNQRASTLSGGQQQRVALARALMRNKPILLLDEPFTALDDDMAAHMRQMVKDLTEQKKWTTVIISHNGADRDPKFVSQTYELAAGSLSKI